MSDVRNLRAWHCARALVLDVIDAMPERAPRRVPGLRSQAIRAATSIPANLAEGCARASRAEFLHFVEIALGSLNELETHLSLAGDTGVIARARAARLTRDAVIVRKLLTGLRRSVQRELAEREATRSDGRLPSK